MKILFLLFPLILLFVQGAEGGVYGCRRKGGFWFCGFLKCPFPYVIVGKCSTFHFCCKKIWG
uniref:Beta-defensin-like domain-containing protein n=1 Tax=Malurus cyaneus samueli TaxID=2593467 RepID=A0A8C5TDS2_9PASS